MKVYRVKDWQKHFENDRSRERDKCGFVCVPNKQHGMGFSYVMFESDGAAIYGIWQLIIGACSQQRKPRNGWLTSDGESGGSSWGATDLSIKFRRPASEITRAMEILSSDKVGWLELVEVADNKDLPQTTAQLPADSPPTPLEEKRREEKEENGREGSHYPEIAFPSWEEWWAYSQRIGLGAEWKARDEWQKQESKQWAGIQKWQAHASRVRTWWESDGRPMQPRSKKPGKNKGPNI